jgi:hypothetical protein
MYWKVRSLLQDINFAFTVLSVVGEENIILESIWNGPK